MIAAPGYKVSLPDETLGHTRLDLLPLAINQARTTALALRQVIRADA